MPGDAVTVVQLCGQCGVEVGTFTVKKDNLMLTSKEQVWCPVCKLHTPEVRDIAGRRAAVQREVQSYPKAKPASPARPPP